MSSETLSWKMPGAMIDFNKFAFMHSAPRFGHSHNIAQLASADMSRRWDYANGIFAFCIFFLSFFIVWAFSILVLKWIGIKRVGWLSGQLSFRPNDMYISESQIGKRHQKIQIAFILCCALLCTGGGLLLKYGLPTIDTAVRETLVLNQDIQMSLDVGLKVANAAEILRASFLESRVHQILLSSDYCNKINTTISTILLNTTMSNYTEESINAFDNFQNALREEEVDGIKSGLLHIIQNLHHFDNMLQFYSSYHWIVRMFLLAIFNFCLFMVGSVVVTMMREESFQPLTFMTCSLILPVFIFFIFVVWLVTTIIAGASMMNSDFCVGNGEGPESTIESALLENGFSVGDLTYKSLKYYQSDCTGSQPWDEKVASYRDMIQNSVDVSKFLLSRIDEIGDKKLMSICGRDFMPVITEIDEAKRDLLLLSSNIDKALELSRCDRVSPLYTQFFNGPTCTKSLEGLSWTFYALFSVCVTGLIIFTLRSALYQIQVIHEEDENSLGRTLEGEKEIKQNSQTILSFDTESNTGSNDQHQNTIDLAEENGKTDGEFEPLTPTPKNRVTSTDFNSPTSSLSSHTSDYFRSEDLNEEITSPMMANDEKAIS